MTYPPADDRLRHLIAQEINPHVASWKLAFFIADGIVTSREVRGELKRIAEAHAAAEHCGDRNCEHCWTASVTAAAPTAVPSAPADRAALRDLAADALADAEGWQWAPGYDKAQSPTYQHYLRQADAVLAVLPEPADRAAILREAADGFDAHAEQLLRGIDDMAAFVAKALQREAATWREAAEKLRRMAGEAQQPETQAPCCSDPTCRCNQVNAAGRCDCAKWDSAPAVEARQADTAGEQQ
jgi:hypothetical protein